MNAHLCLVPSLASLTTLPPQWPQAVCRLAEDTLSIRRRTETRPALSDELARLDALQRHAHRHGAAFVAVVAPYADELACWLWQVALAVGAAGLPDTARSLLASLPGVPADSPARRAQLDALLAMAETPVPRRQPARPESPHRAA